MMHMKIKTRIGDIVLKKQTVLKTVWLLLCAWSVYGVILLSMTQQGYEVNEVLRDPAQQTGVSSLLGLISNLGNFFWIASVAIAFFAVAYGRKLQTIQKQWLLLLGSLSLILAIDDFFLLHDRYINQWICYGFYVITALLLLIRHFAQLIESAFFSCLIALTLMGLSIITDTFQEKLPWNYGVAQILEEGFKFAGAIVWLQCTIQCSISALRASSRDASD